MRAEPNGRSFAQGHPGGLRMRRTGKVPDTRSRKEVREMSTISQDPSKVLPERSGWSIRLLVTEMWAALAIAVMWLAVLFDAIFGPDFVSTSTSGTSTTIPSAIFVAVFAYLGTRVVAKHGFGG
jgi:hypothetical protein